MDPLNNYNNFFYSILNPFHSSQSFHFCYVPTAQFPQNLQQTQFFSIMNFPNSVEVKDFASQTDEIHQNEKKYNNYSVLNQNNQGRQNMEFLLPDKQLLLELFAKVPTKKKNIQNFIQEIDSKRTNMLTKFYKLIGEKILNFKKTKEEVIKFLVRRAWKKQKVGAEESREKYYKEYKSMNSAYLSRIFSEPMFVRAYEQMLQSFDDDFDSFNEERFNRFYERLLGCYIKNSFSNFRTSRQCNSKLPYPLAWKEEIRAIAHNLYENNYKNGFLTQKNQSMLLHEVKDELPLCGDLNSKKK